MSFNEVLLTIMAFRLLEITLEYVWDRSIEKAKKRGD